MTKFVGTPLRGIEFANPSDEAVSARVSGDTQSRVRIDAGGRITWTSGSSTTGQVELYRDSTDLLLTPDVFKATSGVITLTTAGEPSVALADGAMAIDTTNNVFYFRSGGQWRQVSTGMSGEELDGGTARPGPHEAEVSNYITITFDGGEI